MQGYVAPSASEPPKIPFQVRIDAGWLRFRFALYPGLAVLLGALGGKGLGLAVLLLIGCALASLHAFDRLELDDNGFIYRGWLSTRILWTDIARISKVDATGAFGELETVFAGLRGKNWLHVHFRPELRNTPRARAIGLWKVTTYLSIAPMAMPADHLMAVMQRMVDCAKAANVATPEDEAASGG